MQRSLDIAGDNVTGAAEDLAKEIIGGTIGAFNGRQLRQIEKFIRRARYKLRGSDIHISYGATWFRNNPRYILELIYLIEEIESEVEEFRARRLTELRQYMITITPKHDGVRDAHD